MSNLLNENNVASAIAAIKLKLENLNLDTKTERCNDSSYYKCEQECMIQHEPSISYVSHSEDRPVLHEKLAEVLVDIPDDQIGFIDCDDTDIFDFKWNTSTRRLEPIKVYQENTPDAVARMKILVSFAYHCDTINAFISLQNRVGSRACYRDITITVLERANQVNSLHGLRLGYMFRKGQV
jgi:hypothetical protein